MSPGPPSCPQPLGQFTKKEKFEENSMSPGPPPAPNPWGIGNISGIVCVGCVVFGVCGVCECNVDNMICCCLCQGPRVQSPQR